MSIGSEYAGQDRTRLSDVLQSTFEETHSDMGSLLMGGTKGVQYHLKRREKGEMYLEITATDVDKVDSAVYLDLDKWDIGVDILDASDEETTRNYSVTFSTTISHNDLDDIETDIPKVYEVAQEMQSY